MSFEHGACDYLAQLGICPVGLTGSAETERQTVPFVRPHPASAIVRIYSSLANRILYNPGFAVRPLVFLRAKRDTAAKCCRESSEVMLRPYRKPEERNKKPRGPYRKPPTRAVPGVITQAELAHAVKLQSEVQAALDNACLYAEGIERRIGQGATVEPGELMFNRRLRMVIVDPSIRRVK